MMAVTTVLGKIVWLPQLENMRVQWKEEEEEREHIHRLTGWKVGKEEVPARWIEV